ncbi:MAG: MFS transporter [Aggregatilineales bacterium]
MKSIAVADRVSRLKSLPRNVWVTTLTSFLTDVSTEMIANLLPLFLANVLGVSTSIIGLIEGVAETVSSLLKGFSGWFSDKLGSRKWLSVSGYAISATAKPFLYVATSWSGVLAIRFVERLGKGIRTAPRDALIADSVDEHHRGVAFGLHRAGDTAGAMFGLIIALVVVLAMQAQALTLSRETFQTLVLIGIVPAIVGVVILAFGAREVIKRSAATAKPRLTFGALSRDFRVFLIIVAIFTLGNSSDAFLILRAQERGLSVAGVLGMLITFNFVYALFSGPLGALSDRIGRRRLIVAGWLIYALIYLGFSAAATTAQVWILFSLYGAYYAAVEGTSKALVADLVPSEQRGVAYGFYNATIGLIALPASVLAGVLWQGIGSWPGFGPSAPFFAGASLALLSVALLTAYWASAKRRAPQLG